MNKEQYEQNIYQYAYTIKTPEVGMLNDSFDLEASTVSTWTHGEHMLPKSTDDIKEFIQQGHSVFIYANKGDELVGHAAITWLYHNPQQAEIGTIITHPNWRRGKSVGTIATLGIVEHAHALYPNSGLIALANPASKNLFESLGAKQITTKDVDPEAWILCETCPKKPKQSDPKNFICCDTPYDLSPLLFPDNLYYQIYISLKYLHTP